MKKILLLAAAILCCGTGFAQRHSVERLFRDGMAVQGASVFNLADQGASFNLSGNGIQLNGLEVISFDGCSRQAKEQMLRAIRAVDDPGYETWVDVSDDGEHVRVLAKKGGEKIEDVVVLITGDEPVIVRFKGDLNRDSVLQALHTIK